MTFSSRAVAAGLALLGSLAACAAFAGPSRPVVVELYTSQGCSSCPPADALLGKLSQRRDVLALSLPITYWDMLGWKDTLASDANTRRQKAYAAAMGRGGVYTPQMIVDGVFDVVGSRQGDVEAAIAARKGQIEAAEAAIPARRMPLIAVDVQRAAPRLSLSAPIAILQTPQDLRVAVGSGGKGANAVIWLFNLRSAVTVKIGAGENDGRTMTYHNVVGEMRAIGRWRGDPVAFDLPRPDNATPHDGVAVVVQQGGYGPVLGAAFIRRPDYYARL